MVRHRCSLSPGRGRATAGVAHGAGDSVDWPLVMLLALGIDACLGWPDAVFRRVGHPITWIGALIARLDRGWNDERDIPALRRRMGFLAAALVIGVATAVAALVVALLPGGWIGHVLAAAVAAPLIAARSLDQHVAAVARPLEAGDLAGARAAVAMIVGRDPTRLDEAGVARAALESLGESASDGVVAPLLWGAVLGLPGIAAYKAINTLDSMIGHRTARHEDFGKFSARLDDVVNWPAARLTALFLALGGGAPRRSLVVVRADARRHRSPNAGWPEAALAGALDCRLSGPRVYGDQVSTEPWLNSDAPDPGPGDVRRGLRVYRRAVMLAAAGLAAASLVWGKW